MKLDRKKILYAVVVVVVLATLVTALMPEAARVTSAEVQSGPMIVTVDEKGWTRVRDRFVLTSPVAGRLHRVELDEGDQITEGQSVAILEPLPLDARQREEVLGRVEAVEAALREARSLAARAESNFAFARNERARVSRLAADGVVSSEALDQAQTSEEAAEREAEAAKHRVRTAASEVEVARAGLMAIDPARSGAERRIEIASPVSGSVLRILEENSRVVMAGEPLIEIGDRAGLEMVIEVLSSDAVRIHSGDRVIVEEWGGERPLHGAVILVEPSGFTKISALGIEEQRVFVVADLDDPPSGLGDGYRIQARVVIWESENALQVPVSALFRTGDAWSVFAIVEGKASLRTVEIGHRNSVVAEVVSGLEAGSVVVTHPGNEISDGARVEAVE